MEKIRIRLEMFASGCVDSLQITIPISDFFRVVFYSDSKVRMIKLYNTEKEHPEYYMTSDEFSVLRSSFVVNYRNMCGLTEVISKNTSSRSILRMNKSNGEVYLKGCYDNTCRGIRLDLASTRSWLKYRELMNIAHNTTLNYGYYMLHN